VEIFADRAPRKRFDRALKTEPTCILSVLVPSGAPNETYNLRLRTNQDRADAHRVREALLALVSRDFDLDYTFTENTSVLASRKR
jgi:hypothetical protein